MGWIPDRYRRLRDHVWGPRVEDDLADEFAAHVQLLVEEFMAAGMPHDVALREARKRFGDVEKYRNITLEIDQRYVKERRRMEFMDALRANARLAVRGLLRAPGFAIVAVLTLALAIGMTTAMFTLLYHIVLRPLSYTDDDRLLWLDSVLPKANADWRWGLSQAGYLQFKDNARTLENVGAYWAGEVIVSDNEGAERVASVNATPDLLNVLGAKPALGRLFTESDGAKKTPDAAILGYDFWQRKFGGNRNILGSTVRVEGYPVQVVGVMARGLNLPDMRVDTWLPLRLNRAEAPQNHHYLSVIAKRRPDASEAAVGAELSQMTSRFTELFPTAYPVKFMQSTGFNTHVMSLRDYVLGDSGRVLWMLLGAVGLVLLIACANVANLFLARAEARRRDVAVRTAIGASRTHLVAQFFAEAAVLCIAAGALGLAIAAVALRVLVRLAPAGLPRLDDLSLGLPTFAFVATIALLVSIVFGFVPFAQARMKSIVSTLREGGRGLTSSRQYVRRVLTLAQVSLAVVLITAALLLLQSFVRLRNVNPGIAASNVLTLDIYLPVSSYHFTPERMQGFYRTLLTQVRALPGVDAASVTGSVPFRVGNGPFKGGGGCSAVIVPRTDGDTRRDGPCVPTFDVSSDYFRTLHIPMLSGREATEQTERDGYAVVVSRALAKKLWPEGNAIGQRVGPNGGNMGLVTIVGIAGDVRGDGLDKPAYQALYLSAAYPPAGRATLLVRSRTSQPSALTQQIRLIISDLDKDVPIATVETMDHILANSPSVMRLTLNMLMIGVAAFMALLLSAVGLYGVIAYLVAQRRPEIGIRMALGASVGSVARLIIGQSARLAATGIVLGILGAVVLTRLLQSMLFEVRAADPLAIALATVLMLLVTVVASYIPTRRATRVDPVEALRND